jgi:hypothetical protein
MKGKAPLTLPQHLLWEYDLDTFDVDRNAELVIERVLQRGNIAEWRATQSYYGKKRMLEVADRSRQLSERERDFARLFVNSSINASHAGGRYQTGDFSFTQTVAEG